MVESQQKAAGASVPETPEETLVQPQAEEIAQMKQVLTFLEAAGSRGPALEIILPYTGTAQSRLLFVGLELCKSMLRLLAEEGLPVPQQTSVFQILINVVQDKVFIDECIALNAARRVFDYLMKNVIPDLDQAGSKAQVVEDQKTTQGGTTKIYVVDSNFASPVQCAFMFLTNLSIPEEGQKHLLGEGKTKGAVLENIFGMFSYFKTNPSFDFVANIFANVSSLAAGRRFFIEGNQLKQVVEICLDKENLNVHRRKHLLATIRNCCFEYEDYEVAMTEMGLLQNLVKLLVQEQGWAQLPTVWQHLAGVAPKELFQSKIDMDNTREILDALILLCNTDKFLRELYDTRFDQLLRIMKCPAFGETQTKVETIGAQLASCDMPPVEEEAPLPSIEEESAPEEAKAEVVPAAEDSDGLD